VRVNDRGPFIGNRIIDLSYAAALKLDMVRDGTGMVEVTAINFDPPAGDRTTSAPSPSQPTLVSTPSITRNESPNSMPEPATHKIYVQVGAFGEQSNAARRQASLQQFGVENAFVHEDSSSGSPLFRVRIGPVANVEQYDELVKELDRLGINDPYLITE
jgi:rare lipoprotein A